MTAGLFALVLSACPIGAPPAEHAVPGGYNPRNPDVVGRATVEGGEPVRCPETGPYPRALPAGIGFVFEPAYCLKNHGHGTPAAYVPQPGDIVFFVSDTLFWPLLYAFALTGEPYHVGTVVPMPDGSLGVLEAGPPEVTMQVQISPLPARLEEYSGRIYIRRRAVSLTPDQCAALAEFASAQEGKPYALHRLLLQGTPFRARGPVRTEWLGKSNGGSSSSYVCAELTMESLVAAELVDPCTARPRATYMQDMFYDESTNPFIDKSLKLYPHWDPPQQWVPDACGAAEPGKCGR